MENDPAQMLRDIESAPGACLGVVLVIVAFLVFSPYWKGRTKHLRDKIALMFGVVVLVLVIGSALVTTYLL